MCKLRGVRGQTAEDLIEASLLSSALLCSGRAIRANHFTLLPVCLALDIESLYHGQTVLKPSLID